MGQVRALPAKVVAARAIAPSAPGAVSTLFDYKGAILFQSAAARDDFAAPKDTKRGTSAFVRHFADRALGRRLFEAAAAGQTIRNEALVHTRAGIVRRAIEIAPLIGRDDQIALVLEERAAATDHEDELVRILAQAGADWLWETNGELRFSLISPRSDQTGWLPIADLLGCVMHESLPGIDDLHDQGLRRAIDRRESFHDFCFSRRDRNGHQRHFSLSGAPVFATDGVFLGYRGTGRDCTRLVEAEEQIAAEQHRLTAAMDRIPEVFVLFDRDRRLVNYSGRFREENPKIAELMRAGMSIAEIVAVTRRAGVAAPAIDFVAGLEHDSDVDVVVERQSGESWFLLGSRRLPDGDLAVVETNITALKRREAELAEKAALLQATLDHMHQGVLVNDTDMRVVMWNGRFLEMNGLRPDMIRAGMPAKELVSSVATLAEPPVGNLEDLTALHLDRLDGNAAATARVRHDGTVVEHHTNRMPSGLVIRTFTDITQLKEQERRSEDQRRLLTATLSNMDQGMLVLDAGMRIKLWNRRLFELMQVPESLCHVGMTLAELIAAMRVAQGFPAEGFGEAATIRLKDRTHANTITLAAENFGGRTIERRRRPLPDGGMVLTYTDVTEARQRQREIAEKSALLAATLEGMDQGIMVVDADDNIRMWNERLVEQYSLPRDFLRVGMPTAAVIQRLAQQGEFGDGDPVILANERLVQENSDSHRIFSRRLKSGRVVERRRRDMPDGGSVLTHTDITALAERESEIAEKSALLSMVLESMDQGIMVIDADRNIRMWNNRMVEQHDLPANFMKLGMAASEVVHQLARQGEYGTDNPEQAGQDRVDKLERDKSLVFQRRHSNGLMIERRRRPMPGGGTVLTFTDITALTERERALEEKSTHLSAVLGSMDQGVLVLDRATKIKTWNARVLELLNLPSDSLRLGMPAAELIAMLSRRLGQSPEEMEQSIATRVDEMFAGAPRMLGGPSLNDRVIERHSLPMPDGGVVVTYSDVTERKRREDLIAENSALLSATLDNMDQGLVVTDAAFRIKLWNNRLVEMFDLPIDLMRVGRPFVDLLHFFIESHGGSPDQVNALVVERMAELQSDLTSVVDRHRPDGRVIERRRRVMPNGGSVITYGDVTARRRDEAALQRAKEEAEIASRTKTEFLANMSHELRTPLNAIIGFSDILVRQLFGPLGAERYVEYARDIRDSGQHLLNLINDVLDISKIEVNKIDLAEDEVDVPAVIDSCLRLMRDRATAAGVTIAVKMPEILPALNGDDRRLKQILLNLVSNAVKFTPAGGRVEIRVAADASGFRFVVADNGIGIAKSDLETAMRPFGQIDSSLARRYEGTGLGLPLARSMTELHGGRLDIESEPGTGTTVTVWLPPTRAQE
jgi:signal transduction histidine kinase